MTRKTLSTIVAAMAVMAMTAFAAFAASEYEGAWAAKDPKGNPLDITIGADGKVTSNHQLGKAGTVSDVGGTAVIKWSSGWTSIIAKQGDGFVLNSYQKGAPLDGEPSFSAPLQKK